MSGFRHSCADSWTEDKSKYEQNTIHDVGWILRKHVETCSDDYLHERAIKQYTFYIDYVHCCCFTTG